MNVDLSTLSAVRFDGVGVGTEIDVVVAVVLVFPDGSFATTENTYDPGGGEMYAALQSDVGFGLGLVVVGVDPRVNVQFGVVSFHVKFTLAPERTALNVLGGATTWVDTDVFALTNDADVYAKIVNP